MKPSHKFCLASIYIGSLVTATSVPKTSYESNGSIEKQAICERSDSFCYKISTRVKHELAERCILAFTKKNDKVLDPFVGAGTTAVAAAKSGRSAVVIDKDSDYIALSKQRLKQLLDGTLQLRLSGKKIVKPNTKDRVARVPIEWNNGEKL